MESSAEGRCGEIVSDLSIILVTLANLVFFTRFHEYIAWYTKGADGSTARLSLLTDDYSSWLPFPVAASIIVIVVTAVMIVWSNRWFRKIGFPAWKRDRRGGSPGIASCALRIGPWR